ncbi:MAG TPA: hypothetical protein VMT32_08030, partial [Bryobacteraceae bacterium]|nr:hypothetical protein [Bryobacteraceae bacterium]
MPEHRPTEMGFEVSVPGFPFEDLAAEQLPQARVSVLAYCWMTNHVHWIVVPEEADSLAVLFRRLHG